MSQPSTTVWDASMHQKIHLPAPTLCREIDCGTCPNMFNNSYTTPSSTSGGQQNTNNVALITGCPHVQEKRTRKTPKLPPHIHIHCYVRHADTAKTRSRHTGHDPTPIQHTTWSTPQAQHNNRCCPAPEQFTITQWTQGPPTCGQDFPLGTLHCDCEHHTRGKGT